MKNAMVIKKIEEDGKYRNVKIDTNGLVTAVKYGEPSHYHVKTNTGGRIWIGEKSDYINVFSQKGEY